MSGRRLGNGHRGLYDRLELPDDLGPGIRIRRQDSVLHFLRDLLLLRLSLHLLPDTLNFRL